MKILNHLLFNFVGLLVFGFIGSFISGWIELARHYRTKEPHPAIFSTWQTGTIGTVLYRNTLNIGVSEQGLYLSVTFFIYLSHPPLLIPWDDITQVWLDSFGRYDMDVGTPKITRLSLPKNVLEAGSTILATKQQNFMDS